MSPTRDLYSDSIAYAFASGVTGVGLIWIAAFSSLQGSIAAACTAFAIAFTTIATIACLIARAISGGIERPKPTRRNWVLLVVALNILILMVIPIHRSAFGIVSVESIAEIKRESKAGKCVWSIESKTGQRYDAHYSDLESCGIDPQTTLSRQIDDLFVLVQAGEFAGLRYNDIEHLKPIDWSEIARLRIAMLLMPLIACVGYVASTCPSRQ